MLPQPMLLQINAETTAAKTGSEEIQFAWDVSTTKVDGRH
jgi:hypothetical protein